MNKFDINKIQYDDPQVWDLICRGKTLGVFQAESPLVQQWLRKVQPRNLWELSAVISIVRPGSLMSGYADEYAKNKMKPEEIQSFGNPIVDDIFSTTNGVLVYQESLIQLGMKLAWPHLPENECLIKGDSLRKAVSKKVASAVLEIGKEFIAGCTHNGVSEELSTKLFEVIKNCGRYLFNLSHAMSYAYVGYKTAFLKTYFPHQFYTVYLNYSSEKLDPQEELHNLCQDARSFGYIILPPNINKKTIDFVMEGESGIRYGLSFVKFVGGSLHEFLLTLPEIRDWRDVIYLFFSDRLGKRLRSNTGIAMISSGCFSDTGKTRNQLLNAFRLLECLSEKEMRFVLNDPKGLSGCPDINELPNMVRYIAANVSVKKRQQPLESEAILAERQNTDDDLGWIENEERFYLGTTITPGVTTSYEHLSSHTCFDCNQIGTNEEIKNILTIAVIDEVKVHTVKTGKNAGRLMGKIKFHDSTGEIKDVPVFANTYDQCQAVLKTGNLVQLQLNHNDRGFMVSSVAEINNGV